MNESAITPSQWDAVIRYVSQKLGMSPAELADTVRAGGVQALYQKLPPDMAARMKALLGSPEQAQQLMQSKAVQDALDRMSKHP